MHRLYIYIYVYIYHTRGQECLNSCMKESVIQKPCENMSLLHHLRSECSSSCEHAFVLHLLTCSIENGLQNGVGDVYIYIHIFMYIYLYTYIYTYLNRYVYMSLSCACSSQNGVGEQPYRKSPFCQRVLHKSPFSLPKPPRLMHI